MRVLIATCRGADDRKTLAAVRALGRSGAEVWVAADHAQGGVIHSRHCRGTLSTPSPATEPERFVDFLVDHVRRDGFDALLPLDDYTTFALAAGQLLLRPHVGLAVPPLDALRRAHDKWLAHELAVELGLETPATHAPDSFEAARALARELSYPAVLKLRRGSGGVGLRIVNDAAELLESYRRSPQAPDAVFSAGPPLVQEFVPGDVHDVCALFRHGEPRVLLTQRRVLMHPADGGVGIYNETTDEPDLRARAERFLAALDWHGPAQLEFKLDARDGAPRLIDVNTRFWGTLDLSIQAGANFPLLACHLATRGDVEPLRAYRVGLRYRWSLSYGLRHARASREPLESLRRFFAPAPGVRSELSWDDPRPHVVEAWNALLQARI